MKNVDDKDLENVTGGTGPPASKPLTLAPDPPEQNGPPQANQTD